MRMATRFFVRLKDTQIPSFIRIAIQFQVDTSPIYTWFQSRDNPPMYTVFAWLGKNKDWPGFQEACEQAGIPIDTSKLQLRDTA
jgi:hypothetical protein